MTLRLPKLLLALLPLALAGTPALAKEAAPPPAANIDEAPSAAFTGSTAAGLTGTKRVAITNVVIMFQASTGGLAGPGMFFRMFQPKDEVLTVLALTDMSTGLQDALADAAYRQLQAELTAAGYEVVPETEVKASASYAAIQQQAGYANHSRYANAMGDVMLVGAPSLPPYTAYNIETGPYFFPSKTYLGWVSGFGQNSTTPGGPSNMKAGNAWKVPGLEVALAKELNAHVVKATYVVSLGKAESQRKTSYASVQRSGIFSSGGDLYAGNYRAIERTVTGTGTAFAQVGLVADQSHIAFRTPTGNAKWQKVSMTKPDPAKDGDVVVRLAAPVIGGTDYFDLQEGKIARTGGFFSQQQRGDMNLAYTARIIDEPGYGREVNGMIVAANQAMIALIKPAP